MINQPPNAIYDGIESEAGEPGTNNNRRNMNDTIEPKIANVL